MAVTPGRTPGDDIEGSTVHRIHSTRPAAGSDGGRHQVPRGRRARSFAAASAALAALAFAPGAQASFLPPEMMDSVAFGLAWFTLFAVPIGGIVLFWMVHVLPEKIAHKRHHPQRDAIPTLCLLSLVFGGLLWPLARLWAYTKPIYFRGAYGTDKHEDYYREMGEKALAGGLHEDELAHLREELDAMEARGTLPLELKLLRKNMQAARATSAQAASTAADAKAGGA
jgi:hypothetical protein